MTSVSVFVIDDSAVIRTIISRVVERSQDCRIVGMADRVTSARAQIVALRPDVVTVDIAMPGIDGLQFLDEIRGHYHPAIVVVSASTAPGAPATLAALERGADACFEKGRIVVEADLFIRTVTMAAARHGEGEINPGRSARRTRH